VKTIVARRAQKRGTEKALGGWYCSVQGNRGGETNERHKTSRSDTFDRETEG
jgi:hypothetical protein